MLLRIWKLKQQDTTVYLLELEWLNTHTHTQNCKFLTRMQSNRNFLLLQFSSVAQSCLTLCDSMDYSMPGLPIRHQLPKPTQTHVHRVGDTIQPSHSLLSPFPPAINLSQHQGLFQWVSSSRKVAKVLEFQLQHKSFQWIFRTDLL